MTQDNEHSSYREKLIEHLFVGELLKLSWLHKKCSLEISKPEVDNAGFDLIAEASGLIRHIQLKTSAIGSTTASQKVHSRLADKPSGCVVWILFNAESLTLGPFRYFGAAPGDRLPDLTGYKIARHTKGNSEGVKAERKNVRVVPKGAFQTIECIEVLYARLFGSD